MTSGGAHHSYFVHGSFYTGYVGMELKTVLRMGYGLRNLGFYLFP